MTTTVTNRRLFFDLPNAGEDVVSQRLEEGRQLLARGEQLLNKGDSSGVQFLRDGTILLETTALPKPSHNGRLSSTDRALLIAVQENLRRGRQRINTLSDPQKTDQQKTDRDLNTNTQDELAQTREGGDKKKSEELTDGNLNNNTQDGLTQTKEGRDKKNLEEPTDPEEADTLKLSAELVIKPEKELDLIIPLKDKLEPETVLLVMAFMEDGLFLDHAGLSILFSIACNEGFDERFALKDIEYNNFSGNIDGVDANKLRLGIYGAGFQGNSISAVSGGLVKYLYRELEEPFEDWYLSCTKVQTPDFIEQYLFKDEIRSREDRFGEVRDITQRFVRKAKNDKVITDGECNLLISLLNLNSENKEELSKIKKALGKRGEVRIKLTDLRNKLQRHYATLPERIKAGPIGKYLKERKLFPERECKGIQRISDWLEVPIPVIVSYMETKGIGIKND